MRDLVVFLGFRVMSEGPHVPARVATQVGRAPGAKRLVDMFRTARWATNPRERHARVRASLGPAWRGAIGANLGAFHHVNARAVLWNTHGAPGPEGHRVDEQPKPAWPAASSYRRLIASAAVMCCSATES